jgi:hypothetical protein
VNEKSFAISLQNNLQRKKEEKGRRVHNKPLDLVRRQCMGTNITANTRTAGMEEYL